MRYWAKHNASKYATKMKVKLWITNELFPYSRGFTRAGYSMFWFVRFVHQMPFLKKPQRLKWTYLTDYFSSCPYFWEQDNTAPQQMTLNWLHYVLYCLFTFMVYICNKKKTHSTPNYLLCLYTQLSTKRPINVKLFWKVKNTRLMWKEVVKNSTPVY